jgi:glutaredoxin
MLIAAAAYYYKPDLFSGLWSRGAYDDNGQPMTMVFTHNNCGAPCSDVETMLRRRKLDFSLYNVEDSDENMSLWKKYSRVNSFPVIIAGDREANGSFKARLVSVLASVYGEGALTPLERSIMNNHFYDDGDPRIVMYGASWCPGCKQLREQFKSNGVDFEEIDVEAVGNGQTLIGALDINGYPLTYVGYERIEGVNYRKILSYLN